MVCVILENLSITINMESLLLSHLGKPKIKSMKISTKCFLGINKEGYNPYGKTLNLACIYMIYFSHALCTSCFILYQNKCSCKTSKVFLTLSCHIKPSFKLHAQVIHV